MKYFFTKSKNLAETVSRLLMLTPKNDKTREILGAEIRDMEANIMKENENTALAGGGFGISMGSSSPGLGTLVSVANWIFSSSTPWATVENFLEPAVGIEPTILGIPSPEPDPLTGVSSLYHGVAKHLFVNKAEPLRKGGVPRSPKAIMRRVYMNTNGKSTKEKRDGDNAKNV